MGVPDIHTRQNAICVCHSFRKHMVQRCGVVWRDVKDEVWCRAYLETVHAAVTGRKCAAALLELRTLVGPSTMSPRAVFVLFCAVSGAFWCTGASDDLTVHIFPVRRAGLSPNVSTHLFFTALA